VYLDDSFASAASKQPGHAKLHKIVPIQTPCFMQLIYASNASVSDVPLKRQ